MQNIWGHCSEVIGLYFGVRHYGIKSRVVRKVFSQGFKTLVPVGHKFFCRLINLITKTVVVTKILYLIIQLTCEILVSVVG